MGEPGGYKGKCMREDGGIWGCEEGLICVLKNFKVGKCLKPEDPVPTDSDMWVKKGKGITCGALCSWFLLCSVCCYFSGACTRGSIT